MDLIGKTLAGRYEVLEKIGNGGMATVYKAKDKTLNRNVAVKVLKEEFASDQEFVKRFQIEAQSAAALSHPNIVSIYDVAKDGDINYIVMELIVGKTLKEVIKEEGKLDWRRSAEIASQIASGLSTAHKNHIIHRDIKPHNIIMTKENLAKIADFGIAKASTSSTINANAGAMGSVHYFSPEHARGGYTDEKSDIYSLGVVLYEMVTGRLPFDGDTPVSIAMKHLKEEVVPPKQINPEIPDGLNDIILKAMQKEVSSRYVNAHEMYTDLQKILKDPELRNIGISKSDDGEFATQKIPAINSNVTRSYVKEGVRRPENMNVSNNKKKTKKIKNESSSVKGIILKILALILIFGLIALGSFVIFNGGFDSLEEKVEVPNVIGNSKEAAILSLKEAGLEAQFTEPVEDDLPKDYVVKQKIAGGSKAAKGTKVELTLSSGPRQVKVPDVLTDSLTAATMKIRNAELQIEVIEEASEDVAVDKIIRQDPLPNTQAYVNDIVKVYVSTGLPDDVTEVPNVLNDTEESAIEKLEAMGFVVLPSYTKDTSKADGKILLQTPEGGKIAPTGTSVIIVVNKLKETSSGGPTSVTISPVVGQPGQQQGSTTTTTEPEKPEEKPTTTTPPAEKVPDKILNVNLSNKGSKDTFEVKVELNGDILNRKEIYKGTHKRSDGTIKVPYPGDATGVLRVFIDGVFDSEQVIR